MQQPQQRGGGRWTTIRVPQDTSVKKWALLSVIFFLNLVVVLHYRSDRISLAKRVLLRGDLTMVFGGEEKKNMDTVADSSPSKEKESPSNAVPAKTDPTSVSNSMPIAPSSPPQPSIPSPQTTPSQGSTETTANITVSAPVHPTTLTGASNSELLSLLSNRTILFLLPSEATQQQQQQQQQQHQQQQQQQPQQPSAPSAVDIPSQTLQIGYPTVLAEELRRQPYNITVVSSLSTGPSEKMSELVHRFPEVVRSVRPSFAIIYAGLSDLHRGVPANHILAKIIRLHHIVFANSDKSRLTDTENSTALLPFPSFLLSRYNNYYGTMAVALPASSNLKNDSLRLEVNEGLRVFSEVCLQPPIKTPSSSLAVAPSSFNPTNLEEFSRSILERLRTYRTAPDIQNSLRGTGLLQSSNNTSAAELDEKAISDAILASVRVKADFRRDSCFIERARAGN